MATAATATQSEDADWVGATGGSWPPEPYVLVRRNRDLQAGSTSR